MITVDRKQLAAAVSTVKAAAPRGSQYHPVLNGVRIDPLGTKDGIVVTCSDMDLTVTDRCPARTEGDGPMVIPANLLDSFLKVASGDVVGITERHDEASVDIECGAASINLRTYDVEAWPAFDHPEATDVTFDAEALDFISRATYAATGEAGDGWKAGVAFHHHHVMTRDTYRAVVVELAEDVPDVVVPLRTLLAVLKGAEGMLRMGVAGHLVSFATATRTWTSTTMPVEWPAKATVEQVIHPPVAVRGTLTFDTAAMDEALARVNILSGTVALDGNLGNSVISHATIYPGDGVLRVTNSRLDVGDIADEVPCVAETWDQPFRVDVGFMRSLLRSHGAAEMSLQMTTPFVAMFAHGDCIHQALQTVKIT